MEPGEIRTDELLLRPWRPSDAEAVHQACRDPLLAAMSHLPVPFPYADAQRFVADMAALTAQDRAVALGVFDTTGDKLLAAVDLRGLDLRRRTAELGYWSAPWARGARVTERAARALLRYGFDQLGLVRVDWRATVGNHASRLTGLRLGFRMIGVRPGESGRTEEWLAALTPRDLTGAGHEVKPVIRRQAAVFGGRPPTLDGGRVRLRPLAGRDMAAITEAYQDSMVVRWYGVPVPYTGSNAHRLVHVVAPLEWARGTEAVFAITRPDDAWVGTIDLRVSGDDPAVGEVGFLVAPQARGRGYAPAALRALVRWGFDELGLARTQWRAEVGNDASRRVAEKAGFRMEGLLRQAIEEDGRRNDCWIGSVMSREVAA